METFNGRVLDLLEEKCTFKTQLSSFMGNIVICLGPEENISRKEEINEEIKNILDLCMPERTENLCVTIRMPDEEDCPITIWKP